MAPMGLDECSYAYDQANGDELRHKSDWSHELLAGAAAFAGKSYSYERTKFTTES